MSGTTSPSVSASRTIVVAVPNPPEDLPLFWMPKSPGTIQDYSIDVTAWANDAGETVSSFTAFVSSPGSATLPLVAVAQPLVAGGNVCTVMLSGGVSVTNCSVTFDISTPTRTLQLTCWIVVSMLSGTRDRYGNRAVIASANDPGTASQLSALGQQIAAETSARVAAIATVNTDLTSAEAANTATAAEVSSLQGSLTQITANLVAFEQSMEASIAELQSENASLTTSLTSLSESLNAAILGAGVSSQQIFAAFESEPTMFVTLLNAAYSAGAFTTSNTGQGGGFFLDGSFLSVGTS